MCPPIGYWDPVSSCLLCLSHYEVNKDLLLYAPIWHTVPLQAQETTKGKFWTWESKQTFLPFRLIRGYFVSEKNYNTYFFLINSSTNFGSYTKQQTINFKISTEACLVHDLLSTIIFSQQWFYAFPTAEGKYAETLMLKTRESQEIKAHTSIQEAPVQFLNLKNKCL